MYTDEDLEYAVEKGIFSSQSIKQFRNEIVRRDNTHLADEEKFRLVASFNDIFVVIACGLLLASITWGFYSTSATLAAGLVALTSWVLAEFFVLKRKMALPAIFLLITFTGAIFLLILSTQDLLSEESYMYAAIGAVVASWMHWKRFMVPITVAVGTISLVVFIISILLTYIPEVRSHINTLILISGLAVFSLALRWDSADLERVTRKTDIAFWLHLAAAPLIVHPIFISLSDFGGSVSLLNLFSIIGLYLFLTMVSLVVDRRAFMVSSLVYFLTALIQIFNEYGFEGNSLAYLGMIIGFSLLLLSGFWHSVRKAILSIMPAIIKRKVPTAS